MLEVIPEPHQARKMERAFQAEGVVEIKAWWHESGPPTHVKQSRFIRPGFGNRRGWRSGWEKAHTGP